MIQVSATARHARMTPRKIRPLATALRGLPAVSAQQQLAVMSGKATEIVAKLLDSAVANAAHNHDIPAASLKIAKIYVNEGLKMRRYRAASKGSARPILRRLSHVTIVVEGAAAGRAAKKKTEIETVSADVYAAEGGKEEPQEEKIDQTENLKDEAAAANVPRKDKQTGEAFQKTKMMQQGGDKKKTHRRKSV